ncbi:MAG: hypothetical protein A2993_02660 [Gammaproteobacteria bacterium RIFCSPLOWO2_01_FULL_47_190]|nr:MAG: hypothetical protein A2993_02660 [Gammaproteobacteria bacterium RIFCSPLOWO2_01_FULL_47_190]
MEILLTHSLSYTTKDDVPVFVVANSLLANERLINESLRILTDVYPDFKIEKIKVRVDYVSNSSPLKEAFALALFLTYQEDLVEQVPELIQKLTGTTVPENTETLVTVLVFIVAIYIVDATIERLFPGKGVTKLKQEFEEKLSIASQLFGINKDELKSHIEKRFSEGKTKSLFRKTYEFFQPAKLEASTSIISDAGIGISSEAISEVPADADFEFDDDRNVYQIYGTTIEIHRADLDYSDIGWLAVISEVSDKRIKLILPPGITPSELYGRKRIYGDVSVVEEKDMSGEYKVKEYHLISMQK